MQERYSTTNNNTASVITKVALVTDVGTIDDESFNQACWQGVEAYCSANNIEYVESKATGELGMVYPSESSKVYITNDDIPEEGFADMLREKAYN